MSAKKLKIIENIILVTFPAVLFAGCAGSDIKPISEEQFKTTYSDQQNSDYQNPLLESDSLNVSYNDNDTNNGIDQPLCIRAVFRRQI